MCLSSQRECNLKSICKKYSTKTDQTDQRGQGITILEVTLQPSTRLHVAKCAVSHQLTSTLDYLHAYVNPAMLPSALLFIISDWLPGMMKVLTMFRAQ